MKRILVILALAASVQVANAQQAKSVASAKGAVESAKKDVANEKKNTKTATWLKYGQALMSAYNAPAGNAWVGATKQELQLLMGNERPSATDQVVLGNQQYTKETYAYSDYYFTPDGVLAMIITTTPAVPGALDEALEAYKKAAGCADSAKKTKDIAGAIKDIAGKYNNEAYDAYNFGDFAKASDCFEKAAIASDTAPYSQLDTNSIYNSAFTAWLAGNKDKSKTLFEKCLSYNYYGEGGEVYAKLADMAEKAGDKEGQKNYLETAFTKFPQSQSILVGLINYYMTSGEDTGRLFQLLDGAKKNEPNNASLYYVEGNIHLQLNDIDNAVASYRKCAEVDPKYEYGYIGEGILWYNNAVKIQEEAQNEMDDAKYMALDKKFTESLKNCIEPFEKAITLCKDNETRAQVAEFLKNACFRFRTEDQSYQDKYDKYNAIVANGGVM